ncbi:ADP-ribosylglycohydrolase family protein [soil metagenome]
MIRITWLKPEERVVHEFKQLREEGADPSSFEAAWQDIVNTCPQDEQRSEALRILTDLRALSGEDEDLEAFLESLPDVESVRLSETELYDRLLGGWTGRMAGCLLGKPVEKVPREGIRAILESVNEWPLRQYFTAEGVPPEVTERYPWNRASRPTSLRENIVCMPEDDDINYAMLNLAVLETYGVEFTTDDVATTWLQTMPILTVFTAERVAYENLLAYLEPPETARHHNPYREWIGAQIRADLWGWVSPGNPKRAAELAWRDARLSHTGNGIYGEMYVAAMLAAAFTTDDVTEVVRKGLQVVPPESRLAEAVRFVLELPTHHSDWETAVDKLYERYGHYHWVHTVNNAALLTAALLYGAGDFEKTITLAVMGGWDTDCNGASAGAILGTMLGAKGVPEVWAGPLHNRVRTSLNGFDNVSIDELAKRTLKVVPSAHRMASAIKG